MSEDSKVAFYLSLLGGAVYAKVWIFTMGVWMASPMVYLWMRIEWLTSTAILYLDGLLAAILGFIILCLPLAYALRFLFPREAKLAAFAAGLGAFLYAYVPDLFSLWLVLRSPTVLLIIQHLIFFAGPVLAVWMIGRVQNHRLASA